MFLFCLVFFHSTTFLYFSPSQGAKSGSRGEREMHFRLLGNDTISAEVDNELMNEKGQSEALLPFEK